ncbi:hypothetical protein [Mucilaginibacter sp. dw_454]|uniref:hypothetical protein n=1 Tax=Mucilaginibacter sp. dw_454 TaxID=2720079 RepID=UPI002106F0C8|nr:hypothetical protein [Mucilaginibacter sp. dw_454]
MRLFTPKNQFSIILAFLFFMAMTERSSAQTSYELNSGWKCKQASAVDGGNIISAPNYQLNGW